MIKPKVKIEKVTFEDYAPWCLPPIIINRCMAHFWLTPEQLEEISEWSEIVLFDQKFPIVFTTNTQATVVAE